MTQKELDIVNDILNEIVIPENFGDGGDGDDGNLWEVQEQCDEIGLRYNYGATKFVIFPEDCDFVIKIPMSGLWYYEDVYNEETDKWEATDDMVFKKFEGAYGNGWDYCNAEVLAYEDAKEEGFEDFLAETKYIGTTSDGTPAYVQEKVKVSWAYENKEGSKIPSPESSSRAEEAWEKKFKRFANKYWLGFAIDEKTEERVEAFIEFAKSHDCIGADMHGQNFGYRADGSVVLLDYSGFWS